MLFSSNPFTRAISASTLPRVAPNNHCTGGAPVATRQFNARERQNRSDSNRVTARSRFPELRRSCVLEVVSSFKRSAKSMETDMRSPLDPGIFCCSQNNGLDEPVTPRSPRSATSVAAVEARSSQNFFPALELPCDLGGTWHARPRATRHGLR